jgi:hypothetical protein
MCVALYPKGWDAMSAEAAAFLGGRDKGAKDSRPPKKGRDALGACCAILEPVRLRVFSCFE